MTTKLKNVVSVKVAPRPETSVNVACRANEYEPALVLSEQTTAKSIVVND